MPGDKPVRVYVDGCFDMVHFGHANALRQAKQLGDTLVVGIMSDEDIILNKGPPVLNREERYKMVSSIKWVDEVYSDTPYNLLPEHLDKYDCHFCAHGDDLLIGADGTDPYKDVSN